MNGHQRKFAESILPTALSFSMSLGIVGMFTMFKPTYSRREHFTAWLLCSSAVVLSVIFYGEIMKSPTGLEYGTRDGFFYTVAISVAVVFVLFYAEIYKYDGLTAIALLLSSINVFFFILMLLFVGLVRNMYCYNCGPFAILYNGTYVMATRYWPLFILDTLVIASLVVYWVWGRQLRLK